MTKIKITRENEENKIMLYQVIYTNNKYNRLYNNFTTLSRWFNLSIIINLLLITNLIMFIIINLGF